MRASAKPYNPHDVEEKIYRRWERAKVFSPPTRPRRGRKPFVIVIPPPNITGSLHMGHALNSTTQDVLVRYHRMRGDDTLWVPGTDHAGIATQNVVEKELKNEGKTRHDLGREKFVERVWQWKEQYGRTIIEQLRRLGCSCDWKRERFTLDAGYVRAVQEAFIHYARKGLIYRGARIVNWCPRCTSSISDLEVKHEEREGVLYFVRYPLVMEKGERRKEKGEFLVVATSRPETMLGDTAVAVHPDDDRYRTRVGTQVRLPLADRVLPIVADRAVDPSFGTGVVKVTPAHDHTDADIGQRHGLSVVNVIGEDGRITDVAPAQYRGLAVEEARTKIVSDLQAQGLLEKHEPLRHRVALCDRCGTLLQPLVSKQWFVRMTSLAPPAIEVVEKNVVRFVPERWAAVCLDWLRTMKDWCISRQLWWGHRLPVWYCQTGKIPNPKSQIQHSDGHVVFSIAKPKRCPECGGKAFMQDEDVLDTWFSSALWPFAVLGWPEATADLRRFYPTSVLTTAPEILQLWVARMIFSSLEFMKGTRYLPARRYGKRTPAQQVPFQDVIIHQTVLNLKGRRMSKSLGTGVDPMELITQYGADATRVGLLLQHQRDQQAMRFNENAVRVGRNFVNKLWNIGRFLEGVGGRESGVGKRARRRPTPYSLLPTPFDTWILDRLSSVTRDVTEAIDTYRFGDALRVLHACLWDDYADWYVEASKVPGLTTPAVGQQAFETLLRLLHPFLPFVTEALWKGFHPKDLLMLSAWPAAPRPRRRAAADARVAAVQQAVRAIRSAKVLLGISPSAKVRVRVVGPSTLRPLFPAVAFLAGCRVVEAAGAGDEWISLPTAPTVRAFLHREALASINVRARLAAAEKRLAETTEAVERLGRRLAGMRERAPAEAVLETEQRLATQRAALAEQEASVTTLRALV